MPKDPLRDGMTGPPCFSVMSVAVGLMTQESTAKIVISIRIWDMRRKKMSCREKTRGVIVHVAEGTFE
jgi:hypothetical protein